MTTQRDKSSIHRRLGLAVAAGTLALGLSGAAAAHGPGGHGGYETRHVVHHDDDDYDYRPHHRHRHHHRHKHRHHHKHGHGYHKSRGYRRGPDKVVHVYHHDRPHRYDHYDSGHVYERPVVRHNYPSHPHRGYKHGYSRTTPKLNAGSLMGAAIGGLIGSQIGGGTGKLAATAAGTVGGFLCGDHAPRHR